jgi:hypothetical protein
MTEHKIRKAFELEHLGNNPHTKRRNEAGDYVFPSVQDAWAGWYAAHDSLIAKLAISVHVG